MSFDLPWPGLERAGPPADAAVGPFPSAGFLHAWWRHLGAGEPLLTRAGDTLLPLVRTGSEVRIGGDPDLTDYHSPLGPDVEELGESLGALVGEGHRLVLDSLPEESAQRLVDGLAGAGIEAELTAHEVAMVVKGDGEYQSLLDRKQRHEVRRKRQRFVDRMGPVEVVTHRGDGGFSRFYELHRKALGRKGSFLVGERRRFFADLADQPGWRVDELQHQGRALAVLFGFLDADGYYLYNSAYDPGMADVSPGMVLLAEVIASMLESGVPRFDFLKGGEEYKARLGGRPRPLFQVVAG